MRYLSVWFLAATAVLGAASVFAGESAPGPAGERSQRIVFSSNRNGPWRIWCIAPDGRQIVFRRQEKVFVRQLAGGAQRQVSPKDWPHPSGPAWSPDGKRLALACRWDAGNALFLLPSGGGEATPLYDRKPACEPHWSPDGTRLVYETETNICTIGADGKKNRMVTYFGGVQRYGRFSPDGKSIVYCQGPSERGPWELYIIPTQGGTPRQLTEGASDMNPDWK